MKDENELQSRLSQISTIWGDLARAHRSTDSAVRARQSMVRRYQGAAYRYLRAAVRDPDVADELFQEFALRVMQGRFRNATAEAGRFRDYLKGALYRLVADYYRQRARRSPVNDITISAFPALRHEASAADLDQCFHDAWRRELLATTWQALEQDEHVTHKPYYSILRFQADAADLKSPQAALQFSQRIGRAPPMTAATFRKTLERARRAFAELLVREVAHSLATDDRGRIEQELIELDLHRYCRKVFPRLDCGGP